MGEHLERGGVGGELVVGIVEVGFAVLVQGLHGRDLAFHFVLHQRIDLVEEAGLVGDAFAQDEADGALDVVAFLDAGGFGLGADGPGGGGLESGGPEDHAEVGPDRRVLVGEHDHLQAVVRHVAGEVAVDLHHGTAEVLAIAAHGQFGAGIGRPFGEGLGQLLVIPREEEVAEFVVVDCIGVGWIGDPEVAGFAKVTGIDSIDFA